MKTLSAVGQIPLILGSDLRGLSFATVSTPLAENSDTHEVALVGEDGQGVCAIKPDQIAFDRALHCVANVLELRSIIARIGARSAAKLGISADLRVHESMVRWWADEALAGV